MRFLKILGMVVALHVVLFTVFLLSPGCQSNPTTPAPTPAATEATAPTSSLAPIPADENWSSQPASNPAATSLAPTNSVSSTISSAPLAGATGTDGGRATPVRPSNPESYVSTGSTPPPALNPPPTTHVVRAGDNFAKIAAKYGTTTAAVQKANPGVKPQSLRVGQVIKLPTNLAAPAAGGDTGGATTSGAHYTVRTGDSLSAIAARNGTTVTALRQANNLRNDTIQVGQTLVIPGGAASSPTVPSASGYTAAPAPTRSPSTISGDASTATFEHTLKSGETLGVLSKRYGVPTDQIMAANNISDPRKIRAGQKLIIPGYRGAAGGSSAAASTPRAAAPAPAATSPAPAATSPIPASDPIPATTDPLPETQPLIPADMLDAPAIPVDEPTPAP